MRAVVFDVESVLIGWRPQALYRKLIPRADLQQYFVAEVARAPWEDEPVREGAFEEGLRRVAGWSPHLAERVASHHDGMLRAMLDDRCMKPIATLLQRLRAQAVELFGVTDLRPAALTQVMTLYPSTLEQLANITQRRFDPPAADSLYVDQSRSHGSAAQAAGFTFIECTWITPLRQELRRRGFLPTPPVLLP